MKTRLPLLALALAGCYGSLPPEPPCHDTPLPDSVAVQTRVRRDLSRRPREVWQVRQDSSGSWIRHGRAIHYFLTGQASAIEWYRNGKLHGKASYWHENGALQGELEYRDGLAEGRARTWFDDGQLASEKLWHRGRPRGTERTYDRRGRLLREKVWSTTPDSGTGPSPVP